MDQRSILVILGFVLVAAIAGISWALGQRQRRADRLKDAAIRLGLSFDHNGKSLLEEPAGALTVFAPARLGHGEILNVMRGHVGGRPAAICDYHYWTGIGEDRSDYTQTIFCFQVANSSAPDFTLPPRLTSIERKIIKLSAKFWRLGIPERDSGSLYGVEKSGTWMAVWQRNMTVKPEALPTALNEAFAACTSFRDRNS